MKTRTSVICIALLATAALTGCSTMSPRTCAVVGGVVGGGLGILVSEKSHTKSSQTINPLPGQPGEPVTTYRQGPKEINTATGVVAGAVAGAFIGHQVCGR